jgi:hypothetical protein
MKLGSPMQILYDKVCAHEEKKYNTIEYKSIKNTLCSFNIYFNTDETLPHKSIKTRQTSKKTSTSPLVDFK